MNHSAHASSKTSEQVDVLIIGAGIIGATLALELQKSGRKVLMIDRGEPGFGCSYGNAGWVTPCFAMPLPQPGMFLQSIGWMLNKESPLRIQPKPSLLLFKWLYRFLMAMNEKKMRSSIKVLTDISKYSLDHYKMIAGKNPGSMSFDQKGLLMVSGVESGVKAAIDEMNLMAEQGIAGRSLSQSEILAMEPSLKPVVQGGVYFPTEASVEPLEAVRTYVKEFEAAGGKFQGKTEVFDFILDGDEIKEVVTTRGRFKAKIVVMALGSWSTRWSKSLGVSIPIMGGKGYSMITDSFDVKPVHPMMLVDRKVAITPRDGSVRVAGTLELVKDDESINPVRLNAVLKGAKHYLKMSEEPKLQEIWRGLRPCTPDGVPMIGFSGKWKNLFYNQGHQMLGLQSAPGSAKLAADLILGRDTIADKKPFDPTRFE